MKNKSQKRIFDCSKCIFHHKPEPVVVQDVIGANNCSYMNGTSTEIIIKITSDHRCSLYGFKKASLVYNWLRCRKNREMKSEVFIFKVTVIA